MHFATRRQNVSRRVLGLVAVRTDTEEQAAQICALPRQTGSAIRTTKCPSRSVSLRLSQRTLHDRKQLFRFERLHHMATGTLLMPPELVALLSL
jgi:hypothetical protein